MTSQPRRVALLGAGYIADWHCKALRQLPDVQLSAVCDQAGDRAAALAAKYGIPASYSDLGRMLAEQPLDAVHVLLPPNHHYSAARKLLDAGVNVLLEKPMCLRSEECDDLIARARD